MNKLSPKQIEVIKLMQEGWELGTYHGLGSGYGNLSFDIHLQQNGLGKGGKSIKVNANTFWSLFDRKLIEEKPNQEMFACPRRYQLTQKENSTECERILSDGNKCGIKGIVKIKGKWYCPFHAEGIAELLKHGGKNRQEEKMV